MEAELVRQLTGQKLRLWQSLLHRLGLEADENADSTVLIWDGSTLAATGSRKENLLKCIAVDPAYQGQDLTATALTHLRQDAFTHGYQHLFLYTKPSNRYLFSSLFFYPIAQTGQVLLMENQHTGISDFLNTLPVPQNEGRIGAAVMNCNPFTNGHRYLIETAAKECDHVYVFILSENKSCFSPADRMEMAKRGTQEFSNVTILPTGPYLISSATFPTYFLPDRELAEEVHCLLDIEIFCKYYVPKFGITRRYIGTEPISPTTAQYNEALQKALPAKCVEVREVSRLEQNGFPISASAVRSRFNTKDWKLLETLVPTTTLDYLIHLSKED